MTAPRVLIACEYSGTVRDAFRKRGLDAVSCDLLPTEVPGPHYQGDVRDLLREDLGWALMIAHPDCTYLCSSGLHWNKRVPGRQEQTEQALAFVRELMAAPIPRIAIENPVGCIGTRVRRRPLSIRCSANIGYVQKMITLDRNHRKLLWPITSCWTSKPPSTRTTR